MMQLDLDRIFSVTKTSPGTHHRPIATHSMKIKRKCISYRKGVRLPFASVGSEIEFARMKRCDRKPQDYF